jgi:glycine betaine/proline transport system substrate-binding protein|tara:strand:- start:1115 stop:2119 length:1005 start_codon:yes stop_codon:yes gene_type:complete
MKKILFLITLTMGIFYFVSNSFSAYDCKFQMADMNWPSATLMANVDKFILEEGYDCKIELVPGATTATFITMNEKGKPHVAPELWTNAIAGLLHKALEEGRLFSAIKGPITELGEGWWITPQTLKNYPEFKTVLDILERPDLFPAKEDKSKGAFIGCPAGWGCQLANQSLFIAFEMEKKGWMLVDPGSQAGLDGSMSKAAERGDNWFGYYWSPTSLIGKYNMKLMDFGVPFAGSKNWDDCIAKGPEECIEPKPSAWTESIVQTVVTSEIKEMTEVMNYFGKRIFPGSIMNSMLVYMEENQAQGADGAIEFLEKHPEIWINWITLEAAKKIKKAL